MKIALYHNLPPGGAKRAVYEQAKYLSKRHKIYQFKLSSTDENFLNIKKFVKDMNSYDFDISSNLPGILNRLERDIKNFLLLNRLHKKIAKDIDSNGYDFVLVHPSKFTQAPLLLKYINIPSVYFCEEYLRIVYEKELEFKDDVAFYKKWYEKFTRQIRKKIDKDNARSASVVTANSNFTKSNIDRAYGIESEVCHLGVDINAFKKLTNKKEDYILYIGEKNLVGGYELIDSTLKKFNGKNKLKVRKLGFTKGKLMVNDDRLLAKEYSQAIATVCTQHNEPFGLAPIESMACQTPVIAVNEGGYKETIIDGVTGFLLPRDPKLFAEKIQFLIDNPDIARKMGKAGREHVKKNFTWEKHNKKLEKIMLDMVKKRKV